MKQIHSRDNPTLKALRRLASDARRQRQSGQTLIEGSHLIRACLEQQHPLELLVVATSALENAEIIALMDELGTVETLCLPDNLFKQLSELASPVGVLARIAIPAREAVLPSGDCLLLEAIQDAGNVGAILRTAAAAGVEDVVLGSGCAGAWTPRVLRAAQGAHFKLRLHEQADLSRLLTDYQGETVATVASGGTPVYELDLRQPVGWLFGNEGAGLSPQLSANAKQRASIPLAAGCESLNVAAAAAVCLFEMRRQRMHSSCIN